jgi:serine/threonine protein kinase
MTDYTGQQWGSYRLVRLLGSGGFADVYLGEHIHLETQAALKILTTKLASEEMSRFRDEARTIIQLEHPHIVRVLDFGLENRIPFIVMSYAPGGSLRQQHPRGKTLPPSLVTNYVKQIASALQHAHNQKLIHRDVKPENMLQGRTNELLLSDFGIAAIAHSTRSLTTQDALGTIYYMAPEQIQGKARIASDQYALGIATYEWLTGAYPFTGTTMEIAMQHLVTPPPPLREKIPIISPEIEQVVLRALAKKPEERFPDVMAFATALERAREQQVSVNVLQPVKMHPLGTTLVTYRGHTSRVRRMAWSPDSSRIASSDECIIEKRSKIISVPATVQIWDATSGQRFLTHQAPPENLARSLAWSPDGTRIASSYLDPDNAVDIWDATTGHVFLTYQERVVSLAWSPDGRRIVSTDRKTIRIWDVTSGRDLLNWAVGQQHEVNVVAWSPDGTRIASGGENVTGANVIMSFGPERGAVQVWDAMTGNRLLICQGFRVEALAWSPDGTRIASGNSNGTVQVWDAKSGEELLTYRGHSSREEIRDVAWSPDGTCIASGSGDKTVHVWDAKGGHRIFIYQEYGGHRGSIAWSPDSTRIASIGKEGMTVQIWQAT